ncbi:MAG: DUF5106 domain-containing protein [Bacteroidales bacterium]|nr:DUF5106 domain-containing protein [Bacteroidales bacterium]
MRFFCCFFIVLFLINSPIFPQSYKIKVKIDGLKDTTVLLAYHFRDKIFTVDSVFLNSKGKGIAKDEKALLQGQYLIYLPNGKYFDILIDDDQRFAIYNKSENFVDKFRSKGSKSNKLLCKFTREINAINNELNTIQKLKLNARDNKDSVNFYNSQIAEKHREQQSLMEEIRAGDSENLFYSLMKTTLEPQIPEEIKVKDSLEQFMFYKKHFLDDIDFTDSRLIRSNHLYYKINQYLTRIVYQHYDSVAFAADQIIEKTPPKSEMRQFITEHLLGFFALSKYMTHRNIFVHLAEKYYLSGQAFWSDSAKLKKIEERVNSIKPTLVDKIAPDLKVLREDFSPTSLHELVADYTILFIYEPGCGHCREYTPKIKSLSDKYWLKGLEVFALYTLIDVEEWLKFIKDNELENWNNVFDPNRVSNFYDVYNVITTPRLYLLDNNKKIILSDVGYEQIRDYLRYVFGE